MSFSDYSGSTSCGSFNDLYRGHLDASIVSKFDKAGNPVQDVVHITGWETNYRSDKPSVSITAHRSFTVIYTYATDSERDVGNIITQTAPGQGVLFHDVGSITFSGSGVMIHGGSGSASLTAGGRRKASRRCSSCRCATCSRSKSARST